MFLPKPLTWYSTRTQNTKGMSYQCMTFGICSPFHNKQTFTHSKQRNSYFVSFANCFELTINLMATNTSKKCIPMSLSLRLCLSVSVDVSFYRLDCVRHTIMLFIDGYFFVQCNHLLIYDLI